MTYLYKTRGTCSREITVTLEDGVIEDVKFTGGCNGNLKGLSAIVKGKRAEEVIELFSGITCGYKSTSCPDQLAQALKEALKKSSLPLSSAK